MTGTGMQPVHSNTVKTSGRVETVHSLRGLAALAVALFHFSNGNPGFYVPPALKTAGGKGWLGVEVFFVISGFILPYSLWRAGYRFSLSNFGRFTWKRVIRLDPPYLTTIALILLLGYLSAHSPGFHGLSFHVDPVQVGLHLGYLIGFSNRSWLSPVFWTLAIECQFYLLIALIFPLLVSTRWRIRHVSLGFLLMASMLYAHENVVTYYLPLFSCGIIAFQWLTGVCSKLEAVWILLAAAVMLDFRMGFAVAIVGLATACLIVWIPSWTSPPLAFLGTVSYSLYLLHVPIGGRIINLAQRLPPSPLVALIGITLALAGSLGAAYVMYRFVERPAQRYAGSLRFDDSPRDLPLKNR